jgi:hypothetical protein
MSSWNTVAKNKDRPAPVATPSAGRHAGRILDGVRLNPVQQLHVDAVLKKASIDATISIDKNNGMVFCKGSAALKDIRRLIVATASVETLPLGAQVVKMTFDSNSKADDFVRHLEPGVHVQRNGAEGKRKMVLTIPKGKKLSYRLFLTYKDGMKIPADGQVSFVAAKATRAERNWRDAQKKKQQQREKADRFGVKETKSGFRSDGSYVAVKESQPAAAASKTAKKVKKQSTAIHTAPPKTVGTPLTLGIFCKALSLEDVETAKLPATKEVDIEDAKAVAVADAWMTNATEQERTAKPKGKKKSPAYYRRLAKRAAARKDAAFPPLESLPAPSAVMRASSNGAA